MTTTLMVLLTVLTTSFTDLNLIANEPAMVYYSPKNSVVLNFTYTVETQEKGEYAQFAEELLGLTDVLTETRTIYNLENVSIGLRTEVDLSRPHKIVAELGMPIQLLTINEKGLLVGFNLPPQEKKQKKNTPVKEEKIQMSIDVPSFSEDVISRKSLAEQAEAIAQQIFHLREIRLYLLSGELEHAPADGQAMKQVLNELKRQENQLLALFIGKKTTRTEHFKYEYTPYKTDDHMFNKKLYFSLENGFTDAENIDAEEIDIIADYQYQYINPPVEETDKKKKKKDPIQLSQFVYNIPGHACVRVIYKGNELNKKTLPIAQFGIDMPLTTELFSGAELPIITISEKTGNITSISK